MPDPDPFATNYYIRGVDTVGVEPPWKPPISLAHVRDVIARHRALMCRRYGDRVQYHGLFVDSSRSDRRTGHVFRLCQDGYRIGALDHGLLPLGGRLYTFTAVLRVKGSPYHTWPVSEFGPTVPEQEG